MASSFTLGARFEGLIKQLVSAGRYNNASEVVRDGLRMIEERERRLAMLDVSISNGIEAADKGDVHDVGHTRQYLRAALSKGRRRSA